MSQEIFYNKMNYPKDVIFRFFQTIKYPGNDKDCWEWDGYCNDYGYGIFNWNRHIKAHRFVFECYNGPIPDNLFVCHKCDNPPCCNPEHLFLGTEQDNKDDMVQKNRQAFGISNGMAKLDDETVIEILENIRIGKYTTLQQLCSAYCIAESPIRDIFNRKLWKHVTVNYTDHDLLILRNKIRSTSGVRKLIHTDVVNIKTRLKVGEGLTSIARDYEVSESAIYRIKNNQMWKNVII